MTTSQSLFLKTLTERGFIHQCTDLAALMIFTQGLQPRDLRAERS